MGKREDNKLEKSQATARGMVDSLQTGDLVSANDTFDQILAAKRETEWSSAKLDLARTSFDSPETIVAPPVDPTPVDTGITGAPEEVEEE